MSSKNENQNISIYSHSGKLRGPHATPEKAPPQKIENIHKPNRGGTLQQTDTTGRADLEIPHRHPYGAINASSE